MITKFSNIFLIIYFNYLFKLLYKYIRYLRIKNEFAFFNKLVIMYEIQTSNLFGLVE